MDHWGDPWADNASDKHPTKNAVASPLPPAFTFAPVPLNGFVDDAGWGNNEDDGFGDWATSPKIGTQNVVSTDTESPTIERDETSDADWGTASYVETSNNPEEKWSETVAEPQQDQEHVDSEPSDSTTISQPDEGLTENVHQDPAHHLPPDIASSARSSTSPSETSRNELPVESPRTSIEDERIAGSTTKDSLLEESTIALSEDSESGVADIAESQVVDIDDSSKSGDSEQQPLESSILESASPVSANDSSDPEDGGLNPASQDAVTTTSVSSATHNTVFACDPALLDQLFPSTGEPSEQLEAHDNPIYSTSARKAWYRLTRKQTMREFNHGDSDDNYIRVTWINSHVRTEVNKVVSRWAREDRFSGTGPGARASFYWDTPAPAEPKAPFGHLRTQSAVPATKTAMPARQSLPPLATNKPVAFNWSSSTSADPWKLESLAQRSTSTPLVLKSPAIAKVQRQEGRAVSVDLTPRKSEQSTHKRTATVSHTVPEATAVANLLSPPISQSSAEMSDPWANFNSFDTPAISTTKVVDPPVDNDDDDWGEMVQTPTCSTLNQPDPFSQPIPLEVTLPTTSTMPSVQESIPAQTEPADPMFASSNVQLQSTISPTSVVPTLSSAKEVESPAVTENNDRNARPEEYAAWTASESVSMAAKAEEVGISSPTENKNTPAAQPTMPIQASADSWSDTDFSFFETAMPSRVSQPISQLPDPSDPFSVFESPAPTSTPPSPKPVLRSPPYTATPPPLQPLTGATSSLQRQKAAEDEIISNILDGLPDLSYMLR